MESVESSNELPHDVDTARFIWEETVRVLRLHAELAHYYRSNSRDARTIAVLWDKIEEGEYALKALGVTL